MRIAITYIVYMPGEKEFNYLVGLTDAELLALLTCSQQDRNRMIGVAWNLLKKHGNLRNLLNVDVKQLAQVKYIGPIRARRIKAALELSLRLCEEPPQQAKIVDAQGVYQALKKDLFAKTKEYLYLLSLDSRKKLIAKDLISIGTVNEAVIHPREVYRQALLRNAVSIALAHNHPSGTRDPSLEDINVTQRMVKTGVILGIPLIDHVIICDNHYTSMRELNLVRGGDRK